MLDVALLGTGGMLPLPRRWLSAALVRIGRHLVLFDCGEGTQISLRQLGWGLKDIDLILISHVHGDHITGLPGLLLSLGNADRTAPVIIVGPPGMRRVIAGLLVVAPALSFALDCRELEPGDLVTLDALRVSVARGEHHVPCLGYRLEVPRAPAFRPERARALGVPVTDWRRLQRGEAVHGVDPAQVLGPPRRGLALGLVTDSRPTDALRQLVANVDLLICEGTYGSDDDQPRAVERCHMTFREAATLARAAAVEQLWLTHFSPSVTDPQAFAANAADVFPRVTIGHDHLQTTLRFKP